MRLVLALSFTLALLVGCGGVGNDGPVVGGSCDRNRDCADGSFCAEGGDFPGGTCTLDCRDDRDCPGGTACVDHEGGICLLLCSFDDDCRRSYGCRDRPRRGESGRAAVCIDD